MADQQGRAALLIVRPVRRSDDVPFSPGSPKGILNAAEELREAGIPLAGRSMDVILVGVGAHPSNLENCRTGHFRARQFNGEVVMVTHHLG